MHSPHIHSISHSRRSFFFFAPHPTSVHRAEAPPCYHCLLACCRIDGTAPSAHATALPPAFPVTRWCPPLPRTISTIIVLESSYRRVIATGVCQTTTTHESSNSGRS
jgi:hypothetical protein